MGGGWVDDGGGWVDDGWKKVEDEWGIVAKAIPLNFNFPLLLHPPPPSTNFTHVNLSIYLMIIINKLTGRLLSLKITCR